MDINIMLVVIIILGIMEENNKNKKNDKILGMTNRERNALETFEVDSQSFLSNMDLNKIYNKEKNKIQKVMEEFYKNIDPEKRDKAMALAKDLADGEVTQEEKLERLGEFNEEEKKIIQAGSLPYKALNSNMNSLIGTTRHMNAYRKGILEVKSELSGMQDQIPEKSGFKKRFLTAISGIDTGLKAVEFSRY